jgi:hypothetical protein
LSLPTGSRLKNLRIKITQKQLRKDLPPVLTAKDGACNVVLALYRPKFHPEVCSPWQTSNTEFYRKNRKQFVGWMEIEHTGYSANDAHQPTRRTDS